MKGYGLQRFWAWAGVRFWHSLICDKMGERTHLENFNLLLDWIALFINPLALDSDLNEIFPERKQINPDPHPCKIKVRFAYNKTKVYK